MRISTLGELRDALDAVTLAEERVLLAKFQNRSNGGTLIDNVREAEQELQKLLNTKVDWPDLDPVPGPPAQPPNL